MKNKIITLAVLAEARIDENRTPFSPTQISNMLNKFSNLKIIVQPSKRRCFKDKDYHKGWDSNYGLLVFIGHHFWSKGS